MSANPFLIGIRSDRYSLELFFQGNNVSKQSLKTFVGLLLSDSVSSLSLDIPLVILNHSFSRFIMITIIHF